MKNTNTGGTNWNIRLPVLNVLLNDMINRLKLNYHSIFLRELLALTATVLLVSTCLSQENIMKVSDFESLTLVTTNALKMEIALFTVKGSLILDKDSLAGTKLEEV